MNQMTSSAKTKSPSPRQETAMSTLDGQVLREQTSGLALANGDDASSELIRPIMDSRDLKVRVKQIKHAYKQGRFDSQLRMAASNLHDYFQRVGTDATREYWKGRTLLYELNEVFDQGAAINDATFEVGRHVREELRTLLLKHRGVDFMFSERKILREKVLLCGCYGLELGRRGDKRLSLDLFEWLLDFTIKFVQSDEFPCFGTQATLCFHAGSMHRKLEQHDRAESMYSKALNLLYERGKTRHENDVDDYAFAIRKQAMVIGLGFGLINMTRGSLERAAHALVTARSLLSRSKDPIVPAYIELLCGTIERCRAGSHKNKLSEAIANLERARAALEGNARYRVRAYWELALAKSLVGDLGGARKDLSHVASYAEQRMDQKWQANVHILQSRMFRREGRHEDALLEAEMAVDTTKTNESKMVLPLLDALIARGEVQLAMAKGNEAIDSRNSRARSDFNLALSCMFDQKSLDHKAGQFLNPKIAAVCHLRIAQTYAREGDQPNAKSHYASWLRLEDQVEHEWVRELAQVVRNEIGRLSMNFAISASDEREWGYADNLAKLRHWLLTRALRKTNQNYSEAAKLIGVQRATLYQWQAQENTQTKRRGHISTIQKEDALE